LYEYVHHEVPNIDELNEWQDSQVRKQLALKWIKENPGKEVVLILRKLAIYFIPKNYESFSGFSIINPVNLLVHLFFICFLIMTVWKWTIDKQSLLLLTPFAASILLSIVFFVGYRWRYYAEPFMILFAWQFVNDIRGRILKGSIKRP